MQPQEDLVEGICRNLTDLATIKISLDGRENLCDIIGLQLAFGFKTKDFKQERPRNGCLKPVQAEDTIIEIPIGCLPDEQRPIEL